MARFDYKKMQQLARGKSLDAAKLGRRADVSNTAIYHLWNGETEDPGIRTVKKIAKVLGVEIAELITEDELVDLVPESAL